MKMVGPPSATKEHVSGELAGMSPTPLFTQHIFPALWDAGLHYCIDPVGLVAQSYKETGAGAFGGKVSPRFYNTAGIKVRHTDIFPGTTDDDRPLAHQMVSNWEVGAAAHAQHVRAYAGCPISGELIVDPRYVWVNGKFKLTEWSDLSGNWAPLPDLWVRSRRVDAETHNLTYMVVPEGDRLG
jgi:hypothetical protein